MILGFYRRQRQPEVSKVSLDARRMFPFGEAEFLVSKAFQTGRYGFDDSEIGECRSSTYIWLHGTDDRNTALLKANFHYSPSKAEAFRSKYTIGMLHLGV